jgi:nicotinamide-nucleotide amidase
MIAEIISIGDELLIGQTINNNAAHIGQKLTEFGIRVGWITTVGDHKERLRKALSLATTRAEVVIATGGLGPTHDDITKHVVCDFFNSELVQDLTVLNAIRRRFEHRGIEMLKVNEEQALVPEGAKIIHNDVGTAPGIIFRTQKTTLYILPGVPLEMKLMMERAVLPDLAKRKDRLHVRMKNFRTTGIPESVLFEKITNFNKITELVKVAFLPKSSGVDIRLMSEERDETQCTKKLDTAEALLLPHIQENLYATGEAILEETVAHLLIKEGYTLAVAESCTGGLIAHRLTNISGSSSYFERGVVSYSNQSKIDLLNVPKKILIEYGAVSRYTAMAMAEGVRRIAGTDFGLSTTGIAGPTGGTKTKPVGLVFIGFAAEGGSTFERHVFRKDRLGNKERFAQAALNLLRIKILEKGSS